MQDQFQHWTTRVACAVTGEEERPDAELAERALAAGEEVLRPQDAATEEEVRREMLAMYTRDRVMAWGFVVAMLIVVPFVYIALWDFMPNDGVRIVLLGAASILLLYNVASIVALVRNFERDRDFVYRRDVAHARGRAALKALRAKR